MENVKNMLPMVERDEWLHPVAEQVADRHNRYLARMGASSQHGCRGIMRIDDKLFDTHFIDIFDK